MSNEEQPRKATDVLVSLEDKMTLLIKTIASNELTQKLILDRLNKMLSLPSAPIIPISSEPTKFVSVDEVPEISMEPIKTQRQQRSVETSIPAEIKKQTIPVGQKILDNNGKEAFMADVYITDLSNGEIKKLRTNVVGKWQSQLGFGKYIVKISKVLDTDPPTKAELTQEIEVKDDMKSLILPLLSLRKIAK